MTIIRLNDSRIKEFTKTKLKKKPSYLYQIRHIFINDESADLILSLSTNNTASQQNYKYLFPVYQNRLLANLPLKFQQKFTESKLENDQILSLESLGNLNTPYQSMEQYLKEIIFKNDIRPSVGPDQNDYICNDSLDIRNLLKKSNKDNFHSNYRRKLVDLIKISKYFCHDFITNQMNNLLFEFSDYECKDFTAEFLISNSTRKDHNKRIERSSYDERNNWSDTATETSDEESSSITCKSSGNYDDHCEKNDDAVSIKEAGDEVKIMSIDSDFSLKETPNENKHQFSSKSTDSLVNLQIIEKEPSTNSVSQFSEYGVLYGNARTLSVNSDLPITEESDGKEEESTTIYISDIPKIQKYSFDYKTEEIILRKLFKYGEVKQAVFINNPEKNSAGIFEILGNKVKNLVYSWLRCPELDCKMYVSRSNRLMYHSESAYDTGLGDLLFRLKCEMNNQNAAMIEHKPNLSEPVLSDKLKVIFMTGIPLTKESENLDTEKIIMKFISKYGKVQEITFFKSYYGYFTNAKFSMNSKDAKKIVSKSPIKGASLPGLDPNAKLTIQVCAKDNFNGEARANWKTRKDLYQKRIDKLLKDLYV